ncbi:methyl-accepting chemotaxis protein [Anaeromicropila populeti]|uniref:Methyl-accepting chemotaxis sensory transducer with Cache sensor n=1 Tax=Anaeromicropila populeti TaxID=37658 RepID=A0A1I6HXJ1_9FIRM|nr:methyl-accepting chemotaxis protein [Anaeromicropila populeti]SFR59192.1 methyl-accepting chemotaxis sensory transducer with Cache sensor [Anaeromicropila populeti]
MKSIKTKLISLSTSLIACVILGLSTLVLIMASKALENTASNVMNSLAAESSKLIESRIKEQLTILELIASNTTLTDSTVSTTQQLASISAFVEKYQYNKMGIASLEGNITYTDHSSGNISELDFFKNAAAGVSTVSDPYMSDADGIVVVSYAVPIMKNNTVIGVLTSTKNDSEISNLVNDITFGKTGRGFLLNKQGVKIAHYNQELVINMDNDFVNVETDKSLTQVVELEKKMVNGETGSGNYVYNGVKKFMVYCPVNGTTWSLGIAVQRDELLSELTELIQIGCVFAAAFLILSFFIVYFIARNITNRIQLATNYILPMSHGDFSCTISEKHLCMKDEVGQMLQAVHTMQQSVRDMLKSMTVHSGEIDADAQSLSAVAQQMSSSSNVVAASIQEITKGTITQTDSLVLIADSFNEFSNAIEKISDDIKTIDQHTQDIMTLSADSNKNMLDLAGSVQNTNQTFSQFKTGIMRLGENISEIHEITNLINEISDRTNLLSLNAAIEAARAGESGKGFAVVAEEIRKLAEQAKESSIDISALIATIYNENTQMIQATNSVGEEFSNQTSVIHNTVDSFNRIVKAVEEVLPNITTVNIAAEKINVEKQDILRKVEDISAISEETSASTEEISASSEEMASSSENVANSASNLGANTAQMMTEIKKFKL